MYVLGAERTLWKIFVFGPRNPFGRGGQKILSATANDGLTGSDKICIKMEIMEMSQTEIFPLLRTMCLCSKNSFENEKEVVAGKCFSVSFGNTISLKLKVCFLTSQWNVAPYSSSRYVRVTRCWNNKVAQLFSRVTLNVPTEGAF